ncbi:hypothetical protein TrST_g10081 [Triparma strigata]|uniref:TIGR00341 family protein n=1 Tax=Triparma strigata TaxID=1606541 RepID=A0A9W7AV79_9STRA|nr:hypothetical protein TrST_g10081 [Triparma strigata]
MVRSINVTVPSTEYSDTLQILSTTSHVHSLATFPGSGVTLLTFKADERRLQGILKRLGNIGVGTRFGTIDVTALVTTLPPLRRSKYNDPRRYRIDDRMSVEEIKDAIDGQSRLTFDFIAMTMIAAVMSGSGLVGDSGTTVVASMLISPLMGPILCCTFGIASRNDDMIKRGVMNMLAGSLICLGIGAMIGLCTIPYYQELHISEDWGEFIKNEELVVSSEMIERGAPSGLLMGLAVAVPSGVGVTLAVTTSGGINALVGVAISAALVPPIVNAGICVVTGMFLSMIKGQAEAGHNFVYLGFISFLLFAINTLVMIIVGIMMMKLKKVTTVGASHSNWDSDMYYIGLNRSSFLRAGVEMHSRDDLNVSQNGDNYSKDGSPIRSGQEGWGGRMSEDLLQSPLLEDSSEAVSGRNDQRSNSYTGWFGGVEDDDEILNTPSKDLHVGSTLRSFMLSASAHLRGGEERIERRRREEEGRRDSTDMFSPNNFQADLRDMARSISGREEEGEGEGEEEEVVMGGGGGGGGFRLQEDDDNGERDFDEQEEEEGRSSFFDPLTN